MNHQPFDIWLLDDQPLTPEQKRELDAHLRTCVYCAALAETGLALHTKRMVAPAPGFSIRFQARLAAQRIADRRKRFWGMIVFTLAGLVLLVWLTAPQAGNVISSPAEWITIFLGYILFIVTSLQALTGVGLVLLRVVPNFVPPFVWMILISALAGMGLLWAVSIWRFTRLPRGV